MKDQLAEIIGRAHYGLYDWERIKKGLYPGVSLKDAQWVFDTAEGLDKLLFSTVEGIQEKQAELEKKLADVELAIKQARQEVAQEVEGFMQMHLYARPDKPTATMKFTDWVKLRKLLAKYLNKPEKEGEVDKKA